MYCFVHKGQVKNKDAAVRHEHVCVCKTCSAVIEGESTDKRNGKADYECADFGRGHDLRTGKYLVSEYVGGWVSKSLYSRKCLRCPFECFHQVGDLKLVKDGSRKYLRCMQCDLAMDYVAATVAALFKDVGASESTWQKVKFDGDGKFFRVDEFTAEEVCSKWVFDYGLPQQETSEKHWIEWLKSSGITLNEFFKVMYAYRRVTFTTRQSDLFHHILPSSAPSVREAYTVVMDWDELNTPREMSFGEWVLLAICELGIHELLPEDSNLTALAQSIVAETSSVLSERSESAPSPAYGSLGTITSWTT